MSSEESPKLPGSRLYRGDQIQVSIDGMASDGRGTAPWGGKALKVEGSIPGERVQAEVFGRRKRTNLARVHTVEEASPHRTPARCQHFGDCGGCSWQHIDYEHQLELKRGLLVEALEARGLDFPEVPLPLPVEKTWFYRNKMDFDFAPGPEGAMVGLHRRGSYRTLLDLQECFLQSPETPAIMQSMRELAREHSLSAYDLSSHQGWLRNLLVLESKASGQLLVQLVTSRQEPEKESLLPEIAQQLMQRHPLIAGVLHAHHTGLANVATPEQSRLIAGTHTILENIAGIEIQVETRTFLQRNTEQATRLYATVLDFAALQPDENAVDVYCGFGPISMLLAPHVQSVTGFEILPEMIEQAQSLAAQRGAKNAFFRVGAAEEVLPRLKSELNPSLAVVNPPRAGIHKKALKALVQMAAPRLVYVSCSPASLADNLVALIRGGYRLERLQPVDMFPHTPHLETVAALRFAPEGA